MTATLPLEILTLLQDRQFVGRENRDRIRHRFEVVEQPHAPEAVAHHLAGVDAPGHVGQLRNLVRYRARNAERRRSSLLTPTPFSRNVVRMDSSPS